RAYVDVRCLVWREGGVLLDAINLSQKSVRVITVEMQERELCATAANIEFGRATVESRAQRVGKPAVEPVRKKVARQWLDIGQKVRQELIDDRISQVRSWILRARGIHAVDKIGH